jgi:hypothetical protein
VNITVAEWTEAIVTSASPGEAWEKIFEFLKVLALNSTSPLELHKSTVVADRLLAESAWNLWQEYDLSVPKTSRVLKDWWEDNSYANSAVLILDGLSLRQLPALLDGDKSKCINITSIRVTGSELPSDTDHFARALGIPSRSALRNNGLTPKFALHTRNVYTDIMDHSFQDCLADVPYNPNLFIWHEWPDLLLHQPNELSPEDVHKLTSHELQNDSFWHFIDRLRQGRRLVITADHGYAESNQFPEAQDTEEIRALRDIFGKSRSHRISQPTNWSFMPPAVLSLNNYYLVLGQKKWSVQSGFPTLCHGGLSLLEVAVPFVELPPLGA